MHLRVVAVSLFAASTVAIAGCSGGRSGSKTPTPGAARSETAAASAGAATQTGVAAAGGSTPAAPQTPVPGLADRAEAALSATCDLLTAADLVPIGQLIGSALLTKPPTAGAIRTSFCHYGLSATSVLEVRVYVFSDQYVGSKDFAKQALTSAAQDSQATIVEVAGVGDYAGVEIPPTPGTAPSAEFYAQKGSVVVRLSFRGTADDTWPTAAHLTQVGKIAAAKLF